MHLLDQGLSSQKKVHRRRADKRCENFVLPGDSDQLLCFRKPDRIIRHSPPVSVGWKTILDLSKRYVLILAPTISLVLSNKISMYFPNRDELSFRVVFALPNASMIGFVARICCSVSLIPLLSLFPPLRLPGRVGSSTVAKYLMMNFAETVFPAPLLIQLAHMSEFKYL